MTTTLSKSAAPASGRHGPVASATPESAPRHGRLVAVVTATVATLALAALAVWGVSTMLNTRALIGQPVEHDGGVVTVLSAATMDDPMSAMMPDNSDNFAASGMQMGSMASMMSDAVAEGMKRVSIEMELIAGDSVMTFPESDVTLTADGVAYPIYSSMLDDEELRPGHALSAVAIFEVPVETGVAEFRLGPATTPVAVDVAGGGGGHGGTHGTDE